ncbi:transposase [Bacillus songklensis]|uniref:Transposase n=1 Tax=Bacillus songklensis TaxID=1069116 RepID=A0ABV8B2R8_9BACI
MVIVVEAVDQQGDLQNYIQRVTKLIAKGKSTRFSWYKGYKLHLCMSTEGVVLSYAFVSANRYDSIIAPTVLLA